MPVLDDVSGRADLLDAADYTASQAFGADRRAAGSDGIVWPSVRYPGGDCIAAFWPDVVPIPTQGGHFAYHWNGSGGRLRQAAGYRRDHGRAVAPFRPDWR